MVAPLKRMTSQNYEIDVPKVQRSSRKAGNQITTYGSEAEATGPCIFFCALPEPCAALDLDFAWLKGELRAS